MAGTLDFNGTNVRSVIQALVARGEPLRLQVILRGAATALAERAVLRVAEGRVLLVRTPDRSGVDAMARVLLADGGRIEVLAEPPPGGVAEAPTFESLFAEAERRARQVLEPLAPLGGLGAILRADLDRLVASLRQVPDAANRVMKLADGRRTAAQIFAGSPYDEVLTARIVGKLGEMGVLVPVTGPGAPASASAPAAVPPATAPSAVQTPVTVGAPPMWSMPDRGWGETSELPGEDELEVEGPEVTGDIARWLSAGDAPPPLMSDDAFARAFAASAQGSDPAEPDPEGSEATSAAAAIPAGMVAAEAGAVGAPPPAGGAAADADLAAAGVGTGPSPQMIAGAAIVAVLIIGALLAVGGRSSQTEAPAPATPDAGIAPVLTATTTSTVSAPEPILDEEPEPDLVGPAPDALRRTIAAPDAPSDVREAEALWETGQYADAARLLRRLRRTRSNDSTVFVLSGQVYVDTGKLDRANAMANRALALNRRSFRAWVLKGSVQQFKKRRKQALAAYRRALKLGPDHEMSDEIRAVVAQLESETSAL